MKTTLINIAASCLLAFALTACSSDDKNTFSVTPDAASVTFTPKSGGAIMHYKLPANFDIQSIRVRYIDAQGNENIVKGSYLNDSLTLVGFNEARTDIPAYISYVNRQGEMSGETLTTFSTKDSGPSAFFRNAEVKSAWNGVELTYSLPDADMRGLAHIFYIGINPTNNKPDTILAKTVNLMQGESSSFIKFEQEMDEYDIIIKTEDFRGYLVESKEWKGVKSYQTVKFPENQLTVSCPASIEDDVKKFGVQYLTDEDDRGYRAARGEWNEYYTFVMETRNTNNYIDIDLGESKVLANVRLYAQCKVRSSYNDVFNGVYANLLPNELTVYASTDGKDWVKIGYYYESGTALTGQWWSNYGLVERKDNIPYNDLLLIPSPVYLDVSFSVTDVTYRYVRVQPNDTFEYNTYFPNTKKLATIQEIEVYTKK